MSFHSWQPLLDEAYASLLLEYRTFLEHDNEYFPSKENYLNAFTTLAQEDVKYILFGQDPYPRKESAGGYAFIDNNVKTLFSSKGLSTEVNKATSLRNFMKMLLVADDALHQENTTQEAISKIDKRPYIDSILSLRKNFETNGVLLLNTALVFTDKSASKGHIKAWRPFMTQLLDGLQDKDITLILFGTQAKDLAKHLPLKEFKTIKLEHPYNQSFISNKEALKLFGKMNLLEN